MIRISAIEPSMSVVTASRVNETSSPEPSVTRSPSVSSAVLPCSATSTSMPLSSSQSCRSDSSAFASSTMPGTLSEKRETWSPIGSASSATMPASTTISARNTHRTATPRGKRARCSIDHERVEQQRDERRDDEDQRDRAGGLDAAGRRRRSPAAGTTAWIQRGTTTGSAGATGAARPVARRVRGPAARLGASSAARGVRSCRPRRAARPCPKYARQGPGHACAPTVL